MLAHERRKRFSGWSLGFICLCLAVSASAQDGKIPITTSSDEARELYLAGRTHTENLRATDARALYEEAVAKDENFALAHLGLANTAVTNQEFFDALARARSLADQVSEGERLMILGLDAGVRSEPELQKEHYGKLVQAYPEDERAHNLMGNFYFGRQEFEPAIKHYKRATAINPDYPPPYNQLGYAYRFLEKHLEAAGAFRKYIALIPDEPNPYDSYAELLMKAGKFQESIDNYEKALALDPNFVPSYVGIGTNQIFMGKPEEARRTFEKLHTVARNVGEKRQALFWTAVSYLHEGEYEKAIQEVEKEHALATEGGDMGAASGDLAFMGDILLESGAPDRALAKYTEAVEVMDKADVPDEVKEATRRDRLREEARVALKKGDLETAESKADAYRAAVEAKSIPFELWQAHELDGMIALEKEDFASALSSLEKANQQNPRVLFLMAVALQGQGEGDKAQAMCKRAAEFNGLGVNYAYVRSEAKQMLAEAMSVK